MSLLLHGDSGENFSVVTLATMRPSARMRPHSFMSKTPPNKSRCMSSRYKRRIGLGAVSGVVMAFQFGTNWSALAKMSGPIQGPLLSYETFTAFALEPVFLASSFLADLRSSQPISTRNVLSS